ncbi:MULTISPECIES: DNA-binding response regulator [Corynebacterium]|uniref:DNA-binding response regulator n=1 Tax=Corynebacterium TaxID=1716 RepID=UPI000EE56FD6|nr:MULTISPECIES: DNA-binding response regulator [Corynebacterium]MDN6225385.1 DNA-binding response regulator [Corynebacterium flavescens]MDN6236399.1 DNA-binding response regulator [Corynebacterium flavescens]MDN6430170.1 DNA-binding response regulator [Corynebacterium flavescens]MDN6530620.1 DNA-binding response regulator [Corynebacterium flavescens]MDN6601340.1 DNA-binding response regulator [Corynebacterium flavescens]
MLDTPTTDTSALPVQPRPRLHIDDLVGNSLLLQAGEELVVGRSGNLVIGRHDLSMHRTLFQLWYSEQGWMMSNVGRHIPLRIDALNKGGSTHIELGPGAVTFLPLGKSSITCESKEEKYELHVQVEKLAKVGPSRYSPASDQLTRERSVFTADQEDLLRLLAGYLGSPGATNANIPPVKEIAGQLGWTEKKTNQKIDRLVHKLEGEGEAPFRPFRIFLAQYAHRHALG